MPRAAPKSQIDDVYAMVYSFTLLVTPTYVFEPMKTVRRMLTTDQTGSILLTWQWLFECLNGSYQKIYNRGGKI